MMVTKGGDDRGGLMSNMTVEYQDVPGKGVIIGKRLQLPFDEATLKSMFGPVLDQIGLGQLLGELYHWITMPATISSWVLAIAILRLPIWTALLASFVVFLALKIVYQFVYSLSVNRVASAIGQPFRLLLLYVAVGGWLIYLREPKRAMALAAWLLLDISGALEILWNILWGLLIVLLQRIMRKLGLLPEQQQILFLIARCHAPRAPSSGTEKH